MTNHPTGHGPGHHRRCGQHGWTQPRRLTRARKPYFFLPNSHDSCFTLIRNRSRRASRGVQQCPPAIRGLRHHDVMMHDFTPASNSLAPSLEPLHRVGFEPNGVSQHHLATLQPNNGSRRLPGDWHCSSSRQHHAVRAGHWPRLLASQDSCSDWNQQRNRVKSWGFQSDVSSNYEGRGDAMCFCSSDKELSRCQRYSPAYPYEEIDTKSQETCTVPALIQDVGVRDSSPVPWSRSHHHT